VLRANRPKEHGGIIVTRTLSSARTFEIAPPEPSLTPHEMIARASKMIPTLRARQVECEESGNVPEDINNELIRAGFYRIVQPRRFGGYEFDIPTFYRVRMEISRGPIG
jgi:3-hydroxy-9,10-secoandrosta-1,3,5(10)-triene-9,17-dione monooxygenase